MFSTNRTNVNAFREVLYKIMAEGGIATWVLIAGYNGKLMWCYLRRVKLQLS